MSTRSCPLCGHTILKVARFCGACGQRVPAEPLDLPAPVVHEPAPLAVDEFSDCTRPDWKPDLATLAAATRQADSQRRVAARTVLGGLAPSQGYPRESDAPPTVSDAAAPLHGSSAPAAAVAVAPAVAVVAPSAPPPAFAAPPLAPLAPLPAPAIEPRLRTMLGVAMPGIAPTPELPPKLAPVPAPAATTPQRNLLGTLLGVAVPGIAPTPPQEAPQPQPPQSPAGRARPNATLLGLARPADAPPEKIPTILPAPARPAREALPPAPELPARRGVPMAPVVLGIAVLLALGGVALLLVLRSGPPITAQARVDAKGNDALAVRCPSCPDGTTLALAGGAAASEVKAGEALVPLPAPLALGPNELSIVVDRPGKGRDETVKLRVPISYRVRADLSSLAAKPPTITVQVEAVAGTSVEIDGKPVALTAGKGVVVYPLGADALGASNDTKTFEKALAFKVTTADRSEDGALPLRARIVPLHLDAPGDRAIVDGATCHVTGQTLVGGAVTVAGAPATLGSRGEFAVDHPCAAVGPHPIEVVASAPSFATRAALITVTRVTALEAEAQRWETRGPAEGAPVAFEALASPAALGKPGIVEGPVVELRTTNGLSVVLLEHRRNCKTNCLVRLLYGGPTTIQKGQSLRAYGYVAEPVTADGRTLPELHAAFVLPGVLK